MAHLDFGLDTILPPAPAAPQNRLHAFKRDAGQSLLAGGGPNEAMADLHHLQSLTATDERLFVGPDEKIYASTYCCLAGTGALSAGDGCHGVGCAWTPPRSTPHLPIHSIAW